MKTISHYFNENEINSLKEGKEVIKDRLINPYFRIGNNNVFKIRDFEVTCLQSHPFIFKKL